MLLRMFEGPTRAVTVLAATQILGWGVLFYPPALTMAHVAKANGWSLALTLSGFSVALALSGLLSPTVCSLIDRHGGNVVMSVGALAGAIGMAVLPFAESLVVYLIAWLLLGAAMGSIDACAHFRDQSTQANDDCHIRWRSCIDGGMARCASSH